MTGSTGNTFPSASTDAAWRKRPGLVPTLGLFGILALVFGAGIVGVTVNLLVGIGNLAIDTRDRVLPVVSERQRTAVNVERLSRFGEIVLTTPDADKRRNTRLAAQILAQDAAFESDPLVRRTVWNAFEAIREIDAGRDEQQEFSEELAGIAKQARRIILDIKAASTRALRSGGPSAVDMSAVAQTATSCRFTLAQARLARDTVTINRHEATFVELVDFISHRISRLPTGQKLLLSGVPQRLLDLARAFRLQERIVLTREANRELWEDAQASLEELTDNLSTDAAGITARRFTRIAEDAERAMITGLALMTLVVLYFGLMAWLTRRHILAPIMNATRGLEKVQARGEPVEIPRARLKELDDIARAMQRFGDTLIQLAQAKEAAEAANQAKSGFLSSVSHELRTPLTSILGFASMIQEKLKQVLIPGLAGADDPRIARAATKVERNIGIIVSESMRLTVLINDVLDIAKMEAGKVEWKMAQNDVKRLVEQAVTATSGIMENKPFGLVLDVAGDMPLVVCDHDRILQVLINLISNAAKFTHHGHIVISALTESTDYDTRVRIGVADTGEGIAPEDQERIFDKFTQAGDDLHAKPSGTGLGLPICREIVEQHGGRIWVESALGAGSEFIFTLPLEPVSRHEPGSRDPDDAGA